MGVGNTSTSRAVWIKLVEKAVSSTAIFVMVVIGMFLAAALVIFWKWLKINVEPNEFTCQIKQRSYCESLIKGENPNWDEISPKGCERLGITKPSQEECKKSV